MLIDLPHVPDRPKKARDNGITMVMDKGIGTLEAESMLSAAAECIDMVKFGFGTSLIAANTKEKIKLYKEANIRPYLGGTLFEAFVIRNKFEDYLRLLDTFDLDLAEVSDGSMKMDEYEKLEYIQRLSKRATVLSEVGSKQKGILIPAKDWVQNMKSELDAGAWKVIGEARESGTVGIYSADGTANKALISSIINELDTKDILWEAPDKNQQIWFIQLLGPNVNLGNISPDTIIPLESLRLGLRGDTFMEFLPDELKKGRIQ
ncbi:MAG: phosphosulfolactate synthase [Bacteroidota bacterium]